MRHLARGRAVALPILIVLSIPGAASATPASVYAVNSTTEDVSQYDVSSSGSLSAKTPATVAAGLAAQWVTVSPDGKSVYVVNTNAASVSQYDVDADGKLTPKTPATVAVGMTPQQIALSPDGSFAVVANAASDSVSQFVVGADGKLTPHANPTQTTGAWPTGVAFSPDGLSAYVVNANDSTVSQYTVGSGGLVAKSTPTVATGADPQLIAVHPDGNSVYVTNPTDNTLSQYTAAADGSLSAKTPATVATGTFPVGIAVSSDGANAYVANFGGSSVSQYDVGASGALTAKTPASVLADASAQGVAVRGSSVYVTNSGASSVSQFTRGATGALTAKTPATVAAGTTPVGIAVRPDQPPVAAFSATPGLSGSATSFDASAATDPDSAIARYDWDFGDGSTAADGGSTPSHTYAAAGTYTVTLTVTDDLGCSMTRVFTGQIVACNGSSVARATKEVTITAPVNTLPPAGGGQTPPPGSTADTTAPVASALFPARVKLAKALKNGIAGSVRSNEAAKVTVVGRLTRSVAKKFKVAAIVARGSTTVTAGGKTKVVLRFTKKAKRALRRAKALKISFVLTVKDGAGNATTLRGVVKLRR